MYPKSHILAPPPPPTFPKNPDFDPKTPFITKKHHYGHKTPQFFPKTPFFLAKIDAFLLPSPPTAPPDPKPPQIDPKIGPHLCRCPALRTNALEWAGPQQATPNFNRDHAPHTKPRPHRQAPPIAAKATPTQK